MTATQLLKAVAKLPARQRAGLIRRLTATNPGRSGLHRLPKTRGLDMFIAMAGTGRGAPADVSTNKYKHLADAYSTRS